jgi:predicted metal-dependent peptidase
MFHNKPTAEQRIQKAVVAIMAHPRYIALSGVMLVGKRVVTDDPRIRTACTDGRDEWYSRAFVESLKDSELRFLVLHEVYHKIYRHLRNLRWMFDIDSMRANMACDFVINTQLVEENKKDKFATMTGPLSKGCYDTKYLGWDSPRVFRDLQQQQGGGGAGQGHPGEGFDMHDWDGAKDMTAEEAQDLAQRLDEALRQGSIAAGKLGSGGSRTFDELLEATQPWPEVLREFITTTCAGNDYTSWRKPNRRYLAQDIYMPSGVSEQIGEIVVAPDMSGSIGAREVQRMMSELAAIAETVHPEAVRILYWDTKVCGDERYERHELDTMIQSTKPAGGGGTMVECVPEHMAKHGIKAQCAIVFTDGYFGGSWGQWPCPVLWVIVDNKNCRPPHGQVVHVSSGEF